MSETDGLSQRFVDAMRRLEGDGDIEPLVALYAEDCVAGNVLRPDHFQGLDGARAFWTSYRSEFGDVMSEYRNVVEGDGVTALEWETNGTVDGRTVTYQGVTVLEGDDDGIRRSCAYFDPSRLGAAIVER